GAVRLRLCARRGLVGRTRPQSPAPGRAGDGGPRGGGGLQTSRVVMPRRLRPACPPGSGVSAGQRLQRRARVVEGLQVAVADRRRAPRLPAPGRFADALPRKAPAALAPGAQSPAEARVCSSGLKLSSRTASAAWISDALRCSLGVSRNTSRPREISLP